MLLLSHRFSTPPRLALPLGVVIRYPSDTLTEGEEILFRGVLARSLTDIGRAVEQPIIPTDLDRIGGTSLL